jgi:hypothetical protein
LMPFDKRRSSSFRLAPRTYPARSTGCSWWLGAGRLRPSCRAWLFTAAYSSKLNGASWSGPMAGAAAVPHRLPALQDGDIGHRIVLEILRVDLPAGSRHLGRTAISSETVSRSRGFPARGNLFRIECVETTATSRRRAPKGLPHARSQAQDPCSESGSRSSRSRRLSD